MERIVALAPVRADLAGGSLDLWPVGLLVGGGPTVNVALALQARVELTRRPGPGVDLASGDLGFRYRWEEGSAPGQLPLLERFCRRYGILEGWSLTTSSGSPPGAGLGGSSAMSVALASALGAASGRREPAEEVVAVCRDLEAQNLGIPTGVQDFWPALLGGALAIHNEPGMTHVESLQVDLQLLDQHLLVGYSGRSRLSATTNWDLYRRVVERDEVSARSMKGIATVARGVRQCLLEGDWRELGRLVSEEWALRRNLAPGVSTPDLEALFEAAQASGAWGAKACGAGGGGCALFVVPPDARGAVERRLVECGCAVLASRPVSEGLRMEVIP